MRTRHIVLIKHYTSGILIPFSFILETRYHHFCNYIIRYIYGISLLSTMSEMINGGESDQDHEFHGQNDDDNGDTNEDDSIIPKMVFQCENCKNIVGDSMSFSCSTEKLKSITLLKACNVKHEDYVFTSKDGSDIGCSYVKIFCSSEDCNIELGKFYVTTSTEYDPLRDKFTFETVKLTSYELGKNQLGKLPDKADIKKDRVNGEGSSENLVTQAKFEEEITKVCCAALCCAVLCCVVLCICCCSG